MYPIVDSEVLLKRAGREGYQRGLSLFEHVEVEHYRHEHQASTGRVDGFEPQVRYHGHLVDGHCNCPESEGFEFCHHCVALVLHTNKLAKQLLSLSKGPDKSKIFAYLLALDKQSLVKQMLALIEDDPEQFDRYLLRASLSGEDIDFAGLKTRVTEITRVEDQRSLFSQRQTKAFFARIDQLFSELERANLDLHPDEALKLVEYSMTRLTKLRDRIDDRWQLFGQPAMRLRGLFARSFALLGGRSPVMVKRFEKTYFGDRYAILGDDVAPFLGSDEEALKLFYRRGMELWRKTHMPELKAAEKTKQGFSQLPNLSAQWQWRKLARILSELPPPPFAERAELSWTLTLREFLIQSPIAWLEWIDTLESDYGREKALERAIVALQSQTNSETIAYKAVDLSVQLEHIDHFKALCRDHATATAHWMSEQDAQTLSSLPNDAFMLVYRGVVAIDPHHDPEERQYRALNQLREVLQKHYIATLAFELGLNASLLVDHRIALARLLDSEGDWDLARQIRERLIPQLLEKAQNRMDDLAAEQTVLLRKNYEQLDLSQNDFDQVILKLDPLIRQRHNFASLINKYSG